MEGISQFEGNPPMTRKTARPRLARAAVASAAAAVTMLGLLSAATPAQADEAVSPEDGVITLQGAGWGHGKGMSQWGAYGAATKGLDYTEILDFYYQDTTLGSLPDDYTVRVWISADTDNIMHFRPASGLKVKDSSGKSLTLPTGSKYTKWRISRVSSGRKLYYRNSSGTYKAYSTSLDPKKVWSVYNPSTDVVKLAVSDTTKTYRGKLATRITGSRMLTVNYVSMEDYLRSVVPSEMPGSWPLEALKAQAVAARTYAAKLKEGASGVYDLCDTSACQVYKGTSTEYSSSTAAVKASAQKVVKYQGNLALTMFSASNGGWAAAAGSDYPYLAAHEDPYDGVKRDQTWTVTLTSSKIQKAYPSIGTLKSVQVTARDGDGTWGGRVDAVKITGSSGSVNVSGGTFKSKFSLRERLFTVVGG